MDIPPQRNYHGLHRDSNFPPLNQKFGKRGGIFSYNYSSAFKPSLTVWARHFSARTAVDSRVRQDADLIGEEGDKCREPESARQSQREAGPVRPQ